MTELVRKYRGSVVNTVERGGLVTLCGIVLKVFMRVLLSALH